MFSKAAEYAIRALVYVAGCHAKGKTRVGLREIAHEIEVPQRFTANILQDLSRKGLIASVKGPQGGFYISAPANLYLMDVVAAIDGKKQFERCGLGIKHCDVLHPCPIHDQFAAIREKTVEMLRTTSIEALAKGLIRGSVFLTKTG